MRPSSAAPIQAVSGPGERRTDQQPSISERPVGSLGRCSASPNPRQEAPADPTRIMAIARQLGAKQPIFGNGAMEQKGQACDHQEWRRKPRSERWAACRHDHDPSQITRVPHVSVRAGADHILAAVTVAPLQATAVEPRDDPMQKMCRSGIAANRFAPFPTSRTSRRTSPGRWSGSSRPPSRTAPRIGPPRRSWLADRQQRGILR
jgi:hypothetical protein